MLAVWLSVFTVNIYLGFIRVKSQCHEYSKICVVRQTCNEQPTLSASNSSNEPSGYWMSHKSDAHQHQLLWRYGVSQCVWCLGSYNYFHCNHRHNDSHIISEIMTQPHVTKPVTTLSRVRQPIIIACARSPDFTPNQTWINISDTLFQILYL